MRYAMGDGPTPLPPPFDPDVDLIGHMQRAQRRRAEHCGSPPFQPDPDLIGDLEREQKGASEHR